MILGNPALAPDRSARDSGPVTIDGVFHRLARRHPDALALADAANRESFTDGEPRRLTYAQADRMVTAIAGRLREMGLPTDAIVGIQLPNITENILTILGVLRAGMIAAPLPLLWRRADGVAALARIGAKALITCSHVGAFNHGQFAMRAAADVFSIRYVGAFGKSLPDGVVSFDDLFTAETIDPLPAGSGRNGHGASHVAAITFDVGEDGLVPVARNHPELLAAGLAVMLEAGLTQNSKILSALVPASFAGISLTLLPFLLSGGTLLLHHLLDQKTFDRQRRDDRCQALILPASVAFLIAEADGFAASRPQCVIAAWRSPERLAMSPAWREPGIILVDVSIFGEAALVPARRGAGGRPSPISFGPVIVPRESTGGAALAEFARTDTGTVAARGAMVPQHAFPPGIERSGLPHFRIGRGGLVDTGYTCRVDTAADGMIVTGAPAGIVSVGGYRFALGGLQEVTGCIDSSATLAALPDPVLGQRLIGNAADRDTMQAALNAVGVNPIVAAAFCNRSEQDVSQTDAA